MALRVERAWWIVPDGFGLTEIGLVAFSLAYEDRPSNGVKVGLG